MKTVGKQLKLRSVRRVSTFPGLGSTSLKPGHEGEAHRMPGTLVIPTAIQPQGLSSPFSPLFDLELDSCRGARGHQWVERSWSEHQFQDGAAGGTTLQQVLRLCRSAGAFQAQLGAHLQALRASHTGPRAVALSPTATSQNPTAAAAATAADAGDAASTGDAMDASSTASGPAGPSAAASGGPSSSAQHGDAVDVEAIARELLALGYIVQIRDEAQQERARDARSCLQNLRHRFIVCIGCDPAGAAPAPGSGFALEGADGAAAPVGELQYLPEPLVVEPRFREQFLIAHPTPAYEALLQAVPQTFVGNLAKLEAVVKLLCAEMTAAFKAQSLSVPPWRSTQAMMSKWAPQQLQQLGVKIAELRRSIAGASPPEAVAPSGGQQQAVACDGRAYYVAYGSAPACDAAEGVALREACQHPSQAPPPQQQQQQQQQVATHAQAAPATQQQQQAWRPLPTAHEDGPSRMSLDVPDTATAGFRRVPLPHPSCPSATSAATSSSTSPASNASSAHSHGPSSGSASPYGTIRFTRKASAEFKQRANGKKTKSLLAVALRKSGSRAEAAVREEATARARSSSIRVSGDEPWSRITTVRWGGAAAAVVSEAGGAVANGVAALTNSAINKANFQQLL